MNGVVAAGAEDAGGLLHNLKLVLIGLHGQHGLTHHHVVAGIGQPGLLGPGVHDRVVGVITNASTHDLGRFGVKIYAGVGLGLAFNDFGGGNPQAGGELNHVNLSTERAS